MNSPRQTPFERLDALLAYPFSKDDWYDDAGDVSWEILETFDSAAFDELAAAWPSRPPEWHVRLAYALRGTDGARAAPILRGLLALPGDDLATEVVGTLRSLDEADLAVAVDDAGAARLRAIAAADPASAPVITEILERRG